jgi:hypothetical protein
VTIHHATPSELDRLAHKYETLAALRRARAQGEEPPPPRVFKALAGEFPGCLNELDTLPLDTIDARAASLRRALEGAPVEPWMTWLAAYHALLRLALRLKPRLARSAPLDGARAADLAREASAHVALPIDAAFVRAIQSPPGGRLNAAVFERLAVLYGEPALTIKQAIFPQGRRWVVPP